MRQFLCDLATSLASGKDTKPKADELGAGFRVSIVSKRTIVFS